MGGESPPLPPTMNYVQQEGPLEAEETCVACDAEATVLVTVPEEPELDYMPLCDYCYDGSGPQSLLAHEIESHI